MKKKKWIFYGILLVFILIFIASGLYLFRYYWGAKQKEDELTQLQELKIESEEEADTETDADTEELSTDTGKKILKGYRKLYKKNKDIIGWVTVKNTQIDYPVMQTKNDSEYYLHRNYSKEYDVNGLPFLDAQCDTEDSNSNLMVYGHHMKSGLMFAHLMDYEDADFYKKHKEIEFDTLYEKRTYEVVAVFRSQIYGQDAGEDVFKYYNYGGSLSEKNYEKYVKNIKKLSLHNTGITPKYGEQLLTLVTCAYHTENGRFVVVARRKS
jgi:sortase B